MLLLMSWQTVLPFKFPSKFSTKWTMMETATLTEMSFRRSLHEEDSKLPPRWKDRSFQDTWQERKKEKNNSFVKKKYLGIFQCGGRREMIET